MHSRIGWWWSGVAASCYWPALRGSLLASTPRIREYRARLAQDSETAPIWILLSESKRMKALNADRHKSMVSDTDKLVKLARQLDAEIASNPTDDLTPKNCTKWPRSRNWRTT